VKRITYKKGSLFDLQDPNAILAHACNCKGVWGSGIAVEFKRRYKDTFDYYESECKKFDKKLLGRALVYKEIRIPDEDKRPRFVACLLTSYDYGNNKDSESKILKNTEKSMLNFLSVLKDGAHVHSPKINSGRFSVPWEKTEAVMERVLKTRNVKWTVWELPVTT
jgi:ADP-ribose 1''-phosphate phosphatase